MLKTFRLLAASSLLVALAACSTFERQVTGPELGGDINAEEQGSLSPFLWSPESYSGKNAARVWLPQDGSAAVAEIIGAKEQSSITMTYKPETGEIVYSATDVRGIEAQRFPLEADAALAAELGELWIGLAPEIKSGVICGLALALAVPAPGCL